MRANRLPAKVAAGARKRPPSGGSWEGGLRMGNAVLAITNRRHLCRDWRNGLVAPLEISVSRRNETNLAKDRPKFDNEVVIPRRLPESVSKAWGG